MSEELLEFLKKNSAKKELIAENEFAYYKCIKKISGKQSYFESRKDLQRILPNSGPFNV